MAMELRIATLDGTVLEVAAEHHWRVADLKAELGEVTGLPSRELRLIGGLVELKDDAELLDALAGAAPPPAPLRRPPEQAYWLEEVRSDGRKLKDAPPHIKADQEVVLAAVKGNWSAFRSASEELRADPEVVLSAIQENGNVFRYASPALQADLPFILAAIRRNACSFNCASEALRGDRQLVLAAVKENADVLRFVSAGFRGDRDLIVAAVERCGGALQHAMGGLRADREVVSLAVRQDGMALRFASPELKADRDLVLLAVRGSGMALQYASDEVRCDREVARTAVEQDGKVVRYVAPELQAELRIFNLIHQRRHLAQDAGQEPARGVLHASPAQGNNSGNDHLVSNPEVEAESIGPRSEQAAETPGRAKFLGGQRVARLGARPVLGRPMRRAEQPLAPPLLRAGKASVEHSGSHTGTPSTSSTGIGPGRRGHPQPAPAPQLVKTGLSAVPAAASEGGAAQPGQELEGHGPPQEAACVQVTCDANAGSLLAPATPVQPERTLDDAYEAAVESGDCEALVRPAQHDSSSKATRRRMSWFKAVSARVCSLC